MSNTTSTQWHPPLAGKHAATARPTHPAARGGDNHALSPAQLDDRSTIRANGARRQVDAFREIRARLFSNAQPNPVILVAPVSHGCGGSFVARNLAVTVTFEPDKHAVLVDCNLRRPSQHHSLQFTAGGRGLVDYLDNRDLEIGAIVHETGLPRLGLIPLGRIPHSESEYFSSIRMRQLVNTLKLTYPDRSIFLDGPSVLGAPDARILSELADIVVLVAGYDRNTPADIALAASNFDPAKFAGVVFNEGV